MGGPSHQLAAILFSDIVGYTAIMGRDEAEALRILAKNRQIHNQQISKYNGKLIKEMGDGNLVHFSSAVDAVLCAIEIQKSASSSSDWKLRIGIHLAEIVIDNNDVFGDGVNIASRIQAITDPGAIYISEAVQKALRNRPEITTTYLAETSLKNVDYPIGIYAITADFLPIASAAKISRLSRSSLSTTSILRSKIAWLLFILLIACIPLTIIWQVSTGKQEVRIAVLPVENMGLNDQGKYILAGIHSEMIDELSKISALVITSRTSSAKYRNKEMSIPEIALELGVDMILESELIEISDSFRIRVRLIKAKPEEKQLWRQEYYRHTKDILTVFGDLALEVSQISNVNILTDERAKLVSLREVDPSAYQAYLSGIGHLYEFTPNSLDKATQYFNLSISKDSEYAPAYTGLALAWGAKMQFGYLSRDLAKPEIIKASGKALALDNTSAVVHYNLALNNAWFFWDWEEADEEFQQTIKLNPHHAEARAYYAHFLNFMGRKKDAQIQADEALRLRPKNSTIRTLYAMHLNHSRNYTKAIKIINTTLEEDPNYIMALSTLWTVYHNNKQFEQAAETAKLLYSVKGEDAIVDILINNYIDHDYQFAMEKIAEAYISKNDSSYVTPWQIGTLYARAGSTDNSLEWLEKAYAAEDPNMPYINADPIFDELRNTSRFQKLLKKMNLDQAKKQ